MSSTETPSYKFLNASFKTSSTETSSRPSHASFISEASLSTSKGTFEPSLFVIFISGTSGISTIGATFFLSCVRLAL